MFKLFKFFKNMFNNYDDPALRNGPPTTKSVNGIVIQEGNGDENAPLIAPEPDYNIPNIPISKMELQSVALNPIKNEVIEPVFQPIQNLQNNSFQIPNLNLPIVDKNLELKNKIKKSLTNKGKRTEFTINFVVKIFEREQYEMVKDIFDNDDFDDILEELVIDQMISEIKTELKRKFLEIYD